MEEPPSKNQKEEEKRSETESEEEEPTFNNRESAKETLESLVREFILVGTNQKDYKQARSDVKRLLRIFDRRTEGIIPHIRGCMCSPKNKTVNCKSAEDVLYLIRRFIYPGFSSKRHRNNSNTNSTNDKRTDAVTDAGTDAGTGTGTDAGTDTKSSNSRSSSSSSSSNSSVPNNKPDAPARGMTVREYLEYTRPRVSRDVNPFTEPRIRLTHARKLMVFHDFLDFVVRTLRKMAMRDESKLTEEEKREQKAQKEYIFQMLDYSKYLFDRRY